MVYNLIKIMKKFLKDNFKKMSYDIQDKEKLFKINSYMKEKYIKIYLMNQENYMLEHFKIAKNMIKV